MLRRGDSGDAVRALQSALAEAGFRPGMLDGDFGPATEAAVVAFQRSRGLLADGIAGPRTLAALRDEPAPTPADLPDDTALFTVALVSRMFPNTRLDPIKRHLPLVLDAMREVGMADRHCLQAALATIRAETEGFEPIDEGMSRWNTSPGGHPFDLYDSRRDLGNEGPPDGARFKGRGFVQLTGRDNYRRIGLALGLGDGLLQAPDRANEPELAARILACFFSERERRIRQALLANDLAGVRRLVNGGSHGLDRFVDACRICEAALAA